MEKATSTYFSLFFQRWWRQPRKLYKAFNTQTKSIKQIIQTALSLDTILFDLIQKRCQIRPHLTNSLAFSREKKKQLKTEHHSVVLLNRFHLNDHFTGEIGTTLRRWRIDHDSSDEDLKGIVIHYTLNFVIDSRMHAVVWPATRMLFHRLLHALAKSLTLL